MNLPPSGPGSAGAVRKILAIRFARLGDVILLLPALGRLKQAYPEARLTLLTGSPYAAVARMSPLVDEVLPVDRHAMRDGPRFEALGAIIGLIRRLRSARFDLVVDFHSFRETNLLARATGARVRIGMKRSDRAYLAFCFNREPALEDKSLHVAEMFRRVADHAALSNVAGPGEPPDSIVVAPEIRSKVRARYRTEGSQPLVAMYVGASVAARRWPADRFGRVARFAATSWDARVVVLTGVSDAEREVGAGIVEAAGGDRARITLVAGLEIAELAALIGEARLLVSNDSGPMHLGPALRVPTLGIFSASLPEHYRPLGPGSAFVWKERVEDIAVEDVISAMSEQWERGLIPRDRRS